MAPRKEFSGPPSGRNDLTDPQPAVGVPATAVADWIAPYLSAVLTHPAVRQAIAAVVAEAMQPRTPEGPLDEDAAAAVVGATKVTFKRARIEPDFYVGVRPRWRDADSVRKKFAARGRKATTPIPVTPKEADVDVSSELAAVGLRLVGNGRGR